MFDLEVIDVPSILKLIYSTTSLEMMCPTLDMSCEENVLDEYVIPGWITLN